MFVIYTPAEGDAQRWEFLPGKVLDVEAEAVERAFHPGTWDEFVTAVMKGGARARRLLLWHLIKRDHPSLRLDDLQPIAMGELQIEFSRDEVMEIRDSMAKESMDEATRERVLSHLDGLIAEAPVGSDSGKARSKPKGPSTPSRSRTT